MPGKPLVVRLRLGRELRQAHRNTPDGHPLAWDPGGRLIIADHDIVLGPGEVAEFDTRIPPWFGSIGDEPAEVLSVFGPQGERMQTRARPVQARSSAQPSR